MLCCRVPDFPRCRTCVFACIGCFVSLKKKKICWTAVAKHDLLRHFFGLLCGEHDFAITLPQPQAPINSLQRTAMHSKCIKNALLKVSHFKWHNTVHFWCIFNTLLWIVVNSITPFNYPFIRLFIRLCVCPMAKLLFGLAGPPDAAEGCSTL